MHIPHWRELRKPAPVLAAVVLFLVVAALAFRAWDEYVEDGLSRWAVDEIARRSGGTYRLTLGDLSFLPLAGSIAFDSATVATDSAGNRGRSAPLPVLRGRAHECRVSGLALLRLLFGQSLSARALECRRVAASIRLPARGPDEPVAAVDTTGGSAGAELVRPLGLSSFRIARVSLPSLSLTLERPGPRGGTSVVLEHARFDAEGLDFDLESATADRARLRATGLVLRPDSLTEISVARLDAGLTDSTLVLTDAEHEPAIPEAEWVRRVRVRRDRVRFALDSLLGRGVGYRAFLTKGDIRVRSLELRGARLDVLTDRRIPKGPPRRHPTPQQAAARIDPAVRLDTVRVAGGRIVYRERKPETERPGVVNFENLRATVLDFHLPSAGKPLRIDARAQLMGHGLLAVQATVPLDAPDFRYELSGRLGKMPAEAFNGFLSVNESYEFDNGQVEQITFRQTVRDGRARTTVTPRYRDLSVEPTGEGGGVIGSVTRGVREFLAGAFVVRSRNPGDDGEEPLTGRVVGRYDPTRTWLQFLWVNLREGSLEVIKE